MAVLSLVVSCSPSFDSNTQEGAQKPQRTFQEEVAEITPTSTYTSESDTLLISRLLPKGRDRAMRKNSIGERLLIHRDVETDVVLGVEILDAGALLIQLHDLYPEGTSFSEELAVPLLLRFAYFSGVGPHPTILHEAGRKTAVEFVGDIVLRADTFQRMCLHGKRKK